MPGSCPRMPGIYPGVPDICFRFLAPSRLDEIGRGLVPLSPIGTDPAALHPERAVFRLQFNGLAELRLRFWVASLVLKEFAEVLVGLRKEFAEVPVRQPIIGLD